MAILANTAAQTDAGRLCEEGYAKLESGRFDEAHALFARARALAPENALVHYRLGLLFGDTGRPGDALMCFDRVLQLEPDNVRAHNNRGSALQQLGRMAEAEAAFRHALALAPDQVIPYVNLGRILEDAGRKLEAADIYRAAIKRGVDPATLGHHLAAVSGISTDRAPDDWVRKTFDNFAPQFDAQLQSLGYKVPQQLAKRLLARAPGPFDIVDLGCGTGLCGVALSDAKRRLVGVDLSEKMVNLSRSRDVYDELIVAEVHDWLRAADTARFDVVIAADVFIYIGALETVFVEAGRVLRPGGWLAFSTEECEGHDFVLLPSGRYAQSEAYIRKLADPAFVVREAEPTILRLEGTTPTRGRLYLLQRS